MRVRLSCHPHDLLNMATHSPSSDCALPCLASVDTGSCARDDANCLCRNEQFVEDTTLCFESKCSGADLDKSIAAAIAMCRAVVSQHPLCSFAFYLTRRRASP